MQAYQAHGIIHYMTLLPASLADRILRGESVDLTRYVKLGGTLANPRLILDPAGAAVSGGAAVATGGLSILAGSMWDRWIATSGDPCKRLIKAARNDPKRDYRSLLREATLPAPRT